MPTPGDVVLVPFEGAAGSVKRRPSVVVSSALYHSCRPDVVVALLTSQVAKATQPTDYVLQDWAATGLKMQSAYRSFFRTYPVVEVLGFVGVLSARDWAEVQARLRLALAV
jgi:mRNA interferase MazF